MKISKQKRKKTYQHLTELQKWQFVFEPEHNTYLKKLFESKKFSLWTWQDMELLFAAIQSRNPEMVRFLSERKGAVRRFTERYKYPPLFLAMIAQNVKVIELYLNHPDTDLNIRDSSNNNMFHYIFLGLGQGHNKNKKSEIIKLLFEEGYFIKISQLLNAPNDTPATAFDYFLRDDIFSDSEVGKIIDQFLEKGAVPIQLDFIFLREKMKDELEATIKRSIYEKKKLTKDNRKGRILANIETYKRSCESAVSNRTTQESHSSRNNMSQKFIRRIKSILK